MGVVVGHSEVLSSIPNPLPSCLLLLGPEGVGKRHIAHALARATGAKGADLQRLGRLDKAGAKELVRHHSSYPLTSPTKATIADLTKSSPEALNSILKILEEPPGYSRIILHSDTEPLLTIKSRCFLVRFGSLSTEEVIEVLTRIGVPELKIEDSAKESRGRVSVALDYARHYPSWKAVDSLLRAFQERNGAVLEHTLVDVLQAVQEEEAGQTHARRDVIAKLLAQSVRTSLTTKSHVFSDIPEGFRVEALNILESKARASLRVRNAMWVLASGV